MREPPTATSEEREELTRLQAAVAASGDILYQWDLGSDSLRCSQGAARVLGIASLEGGMRGEAFERRVNPEDLPARRLALADHLARRERYDCEYRIRADNGEFRWLHDRGAAEFGPDGKPARLAGVLRLIATGEESARRLEHLASHDGLTGHYSRARLREFLEHSLAYAARYGIPGGYLAIGIDKLALLSETFDEHTVNRIVFEVGRRLDRCLHASDVIGRLDEDSFGVIVSQCSEEALPAIAEKISASVRATAVDTPSGPLHVTVSIGSVGFPYGARTAHEVMAKGEIALRAARQGGRDNHVLYRRPAEDRRDDWRRVEIFEEVAAALREDRLLFAYQPVVAAASREAVYYECLMRMRRDGGELLPAASFIPVVEQLGLIRTVDRKALELAVADLDRHPGVMLAVNVSSITAFDRMWLRLLTALVGGRPDIAERLMIEITETAAMPDVEEMARFASAVRSLGCKVALDDFGAGYSSFRQLKTLPLDLVKIDGAYVRQVADNLDNQLFVRTLVGLAEGLGLSTVAECVEREEDAALLASQGVTYLQGWRFGKPTTEPAWRAPAALAGQEPRLKAADRCGLKSA